MINTTCITVTSSQDKVSPILPSCLKVVFLKSLRKDDSSDIYFCLSSFCGSPAMKGSNQRCRGSLNVNLPPPPPPSETNCHLSSSDMLFNICKIFALVGFNYQIYYSGEGNAPVGTAMAGPNISGISYLIRSILFKTLKPVV